MKEKNTSIRWIAVIFRLCTSGRVREQEGQGPGSRRGVEEEQGKRHGDVLASRGLAGTCSDRPGSALGWAS